MPKERAMSEDREVTVVCDDCGMSVLLWAAGVERVSFGDGDLGYEYEAAYHEDGGEVALDRCTVCDSSAVSVDWN